MGRQSGDIVSNSAAPVTRLPFVTAPKQETRVIGTEATGTLEFPVYRDLTVSESAWMAAQMAEKSSFSFTSRVAIKIARMEKVKPVDAHLFVAKVLAQSMGAQNDMTEDEMNWTVKYVKELEHCALQVVDASLAQQNLLVTAVIRHRLPGMHEWTVEDTAGLPNELADAIYAFCVSEKNRGVEYDAEEAKRELEEALGKSKPAPGKSQRRRSGKKSSTPASSSTPAPESSTETASESSPAPTPSQP